jgi:hypothetical protein
MGCTTAIASSAKAPTISHGHTGSGAVGPTDGSALAPAQASVVARIGAESVDAMEPFQA